MLKSNDKYSSQSVNAHLKLNQSKPIFKCAKCLEGLFSNSIPAESSSERGNPM